MKSKDIKQIDWNIVTMIILSAGVLAGCEYCQPLLMVSIGYQITRRLFGDSYLFEYLIR